MPLDAAFLYITSAHSDRSHVNEIEVLKGVLSALSDMAVNQRNILDRTTNFFGRSLIENNETLKELKRAEPADMGTFVDMISYCLFAIIAVLERQYKCYFEIDIREELHREILSARSHNMDAEVMLSVGKERANNPNVDFLAARMRSRKNKVVPWRLDDMYQEIRESIVTWAIGRARKKSKVNRKKDHFIYY